MVCRAEAVTPGLEREADATVADVGSAPAIDRGRPPTRVDDRDCPSVPCAGVK